MAVVHRDQWLSEVIGIDCLRLDARARTVAGWTAHAKDGAAFAFCKIPVAQIDRVRNLTSAGLHVVDTNVTLDWRGSRSGAMRAGKIDVSRVRLEEHTELQRIAGSAFVYSRFHLDPHFPDEWANRIKREWIRSYCEGRRGECLLVAHQGGRISGFLAVLLADIGGKRAAVIDLIAVDADRRGQGVGAALVGHFLTEWEGRADVLCVGTQIANTASLRLYQQSGFSIAESSYVMHGHLRDGRVI